MQFGRKTNQVSRLFVVVVLVLSGLAVGANTVPNFSLLDQEGKEHELYYYSDASAIVLMVQGNGCPIVRNALHDLRDLTANYEPNGVRFFMLNSNLQDNRESIAAEAAEWEIDLPILVDDAQLVGETLNLTRTAEVLVIDPATWNLVYRGPINDRITYERQTEKASEHYVANVLDQVIAGTSSGETQVGETNGCLINFPNRDNSTEISFVDDVAPILQANCMSCHVEGGIAPWPMNSHAMVRGFAPMIREVLMTQRMPPWHADPHVGVWENDRSLSAAEKQTLVHWIDAGAELGDVEDPLPALAQPKASRWSIGEPDLIIDVPQYTVPATGVVDYQYHRVSVNIPEGSWIRGYEVLPGDTKVVHHLLFGTASEERVDSTDFEYYIGGYAPGVNFEPLPEDTGIYVEGESPFLIQMHYTPYGKEAVDNTTIGLYFYDEPPTNYVRHGVVLDPTIRIAPNDPAHVENAYFTFEKDAILYQLLPHSHYRGKSSSFTLIHPDGEEEVLLSVPNYDFNWQTGYIFDEPRLVKAGSKLIHETIYDNSAQNPGNPDPEQTVTWGLQSWEEMLYGDFTFRWVDESVANPTHDPQRVRMMLTFGVLDQDISGVLERDEVQRRRSLVAMFDTLDADKSDSLDPIEYGNLTAILEQRARARQNSRVDDGSGE